MTARGLEPILPKWLSVYLWTKWLWVLVPLQSLKLEFFLLLKILGKIFEKICWISFITGCGGYILIKSLWFQSTKSLELIGVSGSFAALSSSGLCPGPISGYDRAPPAHPLSQIFCWNRSPQKISGHCCIQYCFLNVLRFFLQFCLIQGFSISYKYLLIRNIKFFICSCIADG